MDEIDTYIFKLNGDNSLEERQKAKQFFVRNIGDEISRLIMPISKTYWEDAAAVLEEIGSPRINKQIPELIDWIKDMNWPGAFAIMELLQSVDVGVIGPYIEKAKDQAIIDKDDIWLDEINKLNQIVK